MYMWEFDKSKATSAFKFYILQRRVPWYSNQQPYDCYHNIYDLQVYRNITCACVNLTDPKKLTVHFCHTTIYLFPGIQTHNLVITVSYTYRSTGTQKAIYV